MLCWEPADKRPPAELAAGALLSRVPASPIRRVFVLEWDGMGLACGFNVWNVAQLANALESVLGVCIRQGHQKRRSKFYIFPRAKASRFPEKFSEKRLKMPWVKVQVHWFCQNPFWYLFFDFKNWAQKNPEVVETSGLFALISFLVQLDGGQYRTRTRLPGFESCFAMFYGHFLCCRCSVLCCLMLCGFWPCFCRKAKNKAKSRASGNPL